LTQIERFASAGVDRLVLAPLLVGHDPNEAETHAFALLSSG